MIANRILNKSDTWKRDVSIEDNVELQIPKVNKLIQVPLTNLTLQNMLVKLSIVISDHIG